MLTLEITSQVKGDISSTWKRPRRRRERGSGF